MSVKHLIHSELKGSDLHIARSNTGVSEPDFIPTVIGELYYNLKNNNLYVATDTSNDPPFTNNWTKVLNIEDMKEIFLSKDNEKDYNPQNDYNPATKKYVDNYYVASNQVPTTNLKNGLLWYDTSSDELKYYFNKTFITVKPTSNENAIFTTEYSFLSAQNETTYLLPVNTGTDKIIDYFIFVNGIKQPKSCIEYIKPNTIKFRKSLPGEFEITISILQR